uniref:ANK_REP_REGION domain-containing protein n=1 Tax=Macrostomum lignano TaxID=282301 RepID=A0A1I8HNG0_9PLAT
VNVDITAEDGFTPVFHAAASGYAPEAVAVLLRAGANVDSSLNTGGRPLHFAVWNGYQEVAKLLISARANVDARNSDGDTPLHHAIYKRRAELVAMLLRAGARVDLLNNRGQTPLALAVDKTSPEIVSELIRAGASADMSSNNNKDLVKEALECRQLSMAHMLIDASAKIDEKKSSEWFKLALMAGFTEALQLLIDAGVRLDQTEPMGLMLSFFTSFQENASVRKLLAAGADIPADLTSFFFAISAPDPSNPAAAPTVRSAEEQRQFSSRLSEAMRAAGFKQANAAVQSGAAAALQDILRDLMDDKDTFVFGSFADGWGSSLEILNGEISRDSDIDVTFMESGRLLCLDCGSAGWTACSGCGRDAIRVQCENGHAYYEHGSTGPNMARNQPFEFTTIFSGTHVNIDLISAVTCCRYPRIELLQLGYSNRRGQPSQMPQRILNQLEQEALSHSPKEDSEQEALSHSPKCHAVAASPPHKPPGSCMRVSTTLLERAVMHSLTTVQGQFFILVKFLIKKVISIEMKVSGLKTYMAKNLLFYMLDETPEEEWKPDNLLQLVRQSLQLLVAMMESSDSDTVCMKHFFLRDADVYFKKGQQPKKDIVDAVNGVIDELPRWLHQFQGQLRENASNSVRFQPFQLLDEFCTSRDVQRYSGYSSICGLVRHCLLKLGSDRRGQSESEHLSELLQLIGELPDCARSARESLRLMAHLKFHAPLDAAGAAAGLTGQESSGIECPESPGGGSELLSVDEAKELVWRHLHETDSANLLANPKFRDRSSDLYIESFRRFYRQLPPEDIRYLRAALVAQSMIRALDKALAEAESLQAGAEPGEMQQSNCLLDEGAERERRLQNFLKLEQHWMQLMMGSSDSDTLSGKMLFCLIGVLVELQSFLKERLALVKDGDARSTASRQRSSECTGYASSQHLVGRAVSTKDGGLEAPLDVESGETAIHIARWMWTLKSAEQKVMTEHEPPPVTFGRPLGRPEPPQFDSVLESLESGDCGLLTEWLSRGGSPDEQDSNGRSFLHVASFLGNADAAQLLVEASANVDLAAADGFTPLHEAVLGGSERLTRLLLRAGASPAVRTVSGALPMHLAAIIGSGDDIARLLAGPTCAATDSRQAATGLGPLRTPLFLSVFYGRAGAVDALTAAGADSNCCTSEIVMDSQLLLFEGRPAMSAAARLGNAEIVRILLSVAADPDRRNPNCPRGLTPLHEAVLFRNIDVMSHLISAGVNVEITDEKGFTPLQFCAVSDSATEAAAVLIRAGAKVDSSSDAGLAPLHIAAYSGCKEVAKLLIGARANVDITDKKGCTNLQYGVVNDCATEAAARANVDSSSDT